MPRRIIHPLPLLTLTTNGYPMRLQLGGDRPQMQRKSLHLVSEPGLLSYMPKYMPRNIAMEGGKKQDGSISLQYPMLAKNNYTAWAIKMKVFMQAQGVWDTIEPTDPRKAVEDRHDKMAMAAIYQGIPEETLLSLAEKSSAREAWETLRTMYLGADRVKTAKIQTLKAEFEVLVMKETEGIDEFAMKVNNIVNNIRVLGDKIEEAYVVKKLLRAVPSKFLQIASAIEQFGDLDSMMVEEVVGRLKAHEERLKGQSDSAGSTQLLLTQEEWRSRSKKPVEGESPNAAKSHTKQSGFCRGRGRGRGRGMFGGRGGRHNSSHFSNREYGRGSGGNRDRSKLKCYNCDGVGHYASECRRPRREGNQQETNMAQFHDEEPTLLMNESVDGPVDAVLTKIEVCNFRHKNGEQRVLKNVYFIPRLCNNILSLGQLTEAGNKVVMDGPMLWVYDKQGNLLMKVFRSQNRLYKVMLEECESMCLISSEEETTWLWHARLGHVNFGTLESMASKELVTGLPKIHQPNKLCEGCLVGKQTREPFPSQASDDYSRAMWLYMLKTKNEAFEAFKKCRENVENQANCKIKTLRTDRGGEFMSQDFTNFCEEVGIASKSLPASLWGEAVRHAVYLLNRVTTKALTNATPFEAWSGRKPSVEHIKVFGCVAHMKVPKPYLKKLDDRSHKVIHLGVEVGTQAYRLYDPETGKLHVSRDVKFEEDKSRPWSVEEENEVRESLPFTVQAVATNEPQPEFTEVNSPASPFTPLTQVSSCSSSIGTPGEWSNLQVPDTPGFTTPTQSVSQVGESSGKSSEESSEYGPKGYRPLADTYTRAKVKSAFLNNDLKEDIYVLQPDGFIVKGKEDMVYKLNKALYGLQQSLRAWNVRLDNSLKKLPEPIVYKSMKPDYILIVGVYVDNLLMMGSNDRGIQIKF
ncbi:hypothetical protein E3N88_04618 [Mikania micrantha]|uniref:CCHC-type domain-containing protein n=1 Tax=Mikania micrantha TaxID=192012 RepID=A0A5N6PXR1_9ASTR|nr:hypothetical protein E3N88_04618 [Mikania micrantha]